MKKIYFLVLSLFLFTFELHANDIDTLYYGSFGKLVIYKPIKKPDALVLFISGDGGWNKEVAEMAKKVVAQGALVAGIDLKIYLKKIESQKRKCHYPASDFEDLSLTLQKKYKFKHYFKPLLVGYSSGSTLVYGILAQSPANTFKGAISLGFCPDIEIDEPLCNGSGLKSHVIKEKFSYYLEPCKHLSAPFIVLQGMVDQVCSYSDTKKYVKKIPSAELVSLPNVGHGFSNANSWLPQFIASYDKIMKEPGFVEKKTAENKLLQEQHLAPLDSTMPLALIPTGKKGNLPIAFFISGDGGWTSFDHSVCEKLAEKGMPVVGLDAQEYFWNEKKPKVAADEIENAIAHYMKQWNRNSFVLVGFSFGACVAPFIANNFNASFKKSLKGVYSISPDETCDFEIHITDMLSINNDEKNDVLREFRTISLLNPVCIFGIDEDIEIRKHFSMNGTKVETLPGSHHYNDDFNAVASIILKDFKQGN